MTTEIAVATAADLEVLSPEQREAAVTAYLSTARDRLALALEATGPHAVAQLKAEIATAAEATKQLGLSREIQLDAQEMVRRAEYALGKAIRAGQEAGTIRRQGQVESRANQHGRVGESVDSGYSSPLDFAAAHELHGQSGEGNGIYGLVDGVPAEQFEKALDEAKAEGNLGRANVVRKVKGEPSKLSGDARIAKIDLFAQRGMTSKQIADQLGHTDDYIRQLARENGVEIPADKVVGRTASNRRVDSNRVVDETVATLDGLTFALRLIHYDDLDSTQLRRWADSLNDSMPAVNRFVRQIREKAQQ